MTENHQTIGFNNEPPDNVIFYAKYGKSIPCDQRHEPTDNLPQGKVKISWQVMNNGHFVHANEVPNVRIVKPNGVLIFVPINESLYDSLIHFANYRCVIDYEHGSLASRTVRIKAGKFHFMIIISNDIIMSDYQRGFFNQIE